MSYARSPRLVSWTTMGMSVVARGAGASEYFITMSFSTSQLKRHSWGFRASTLQRHYDIYIHLPSGMSKGNGSGPHSDKTTSQDLAAHSNVPIYISKNRSAGK